MAQIDEEHSNIEKLDKKDEKIIEILRFNSRISWQQIAKKVSLSNDAVNYRIKRMEKSKLIDRYELELNYSKIGLKKFHIIFQIIEGEQKKREKLYSHLSKMKEVISMINYSGKHDLKIIVIKNNIEEINNLLNDINTKFSGIIIEETVLIELDEKNEKPLKLDEKDKKIIDILSKNSRESFVEISNKTSFNVDTIAYRIKNLIANKVIINFLMIPNLNKIGFHFYNILILTKGNDDEKIEKIISDKLAVKSYKTFGKWNYILDINARDNKDYYLKANKIINILSSRLKDYDTLMAYKEFK